MHTNRARGPYKTRLSAFDHLLGSMPDAEIAAMAGASVQTVRNRRLRALIPRAPVPAPPAPTLADFVVRPHAELVGVIAELREIAARVGLSRERIRQIRAVLGVAVAPSSTLAPEYVAALGTAPDPEIGERFGYHRNAVGKHRRERGIPEFRMPRPWLHLLGVVTDLEIADRFGVAQGGVTRIRNELGIPTAPVSARRPYGSRKGRAA